MGLAASVAPTPYERLLCKTEAGTAGQRLKVDSMEQLGWSTWADQRFGQATPAVAAAVAAGVRHAHLLSLTAHLGAEADTQDTYGHTMKRKQFTEVAACLSVLPGACLQQLAGTSARLDIALVNGVAVYPWRYGNRRGTSTTAARMRAPVSDRRRSLLLPAARAATSYQRSIFDPDGEEFEAELAEEIELNRQFGRLHRLVTVGVCSSPEGLFDISWGEVELVDPRTGEVRWVHHEQLPLSDSGGNGGQFATAGPNGAGSGGGAGGVDRFDSGAADDDLGMTAIPEDPSRVGGADAAVTVNP
jgi:hypothetical protein